MRHAMCAKRQALERELNIAHTRKMAFERLLGARQDLDPQEKAERDKVYSAYDLKTAEIAQHNADVPLNKCGCK
jgi:hypothetical protein